MTRDIQEMPQRHWRVVEPQWKDYRKMICPADQFRRLFEVTRKIARPMICKCGRQGNCQVTGIEASNVAMT
jgi:hypothetical protein